MDSFNHNHQNNSFRYNQDHDHDDDDVDDEFTGILDIYVHHARNIHNICIYDNQDVYAKFSLTYNPDEILSTRIISKGGKNPTFNENLRMKITQIDAVLKCEIWMFSRSRIHMEDQLLGFTLVPISQIVAKGKVTEDYSLSSTDLFHSPAGIVQLTLSLVTDSSVNLVTDSANSSSSISSEVILLDRKISQVMLDPLHPVEYSRIEFPDITVVKENQQMVSEYFNLASASRSNNSVNLLPFLHLGSSPQVDDYEMTQSSPNESIQNSGFLSSSLTSLSDDRNSADSNDKKNHLEGQSANSKITVEEGSQSQNSSATCPDTPTSKKENEARNDKEEKEIEGAKFGQVFSSPLGNINLEAEQSAMQKQIVDMYMRSMQQFTESLAKMKLPMDLDKPEREDIGDVIQNHDKNKLENDNNNKKKDGSRVFYGSRAFF